LVVPAGTEIGLEVRESLALSKHWRLVAANSVRDHSETRYHQCIFDLPLATAPEFVSAVRQAAIDVGADYVIPAHDDAIFSLSGQDLGGALLVGPGPRLAEILRFKSKTYAALRDVVRCPIVIDPLQAEAQNLPVFAKPDRGQGSRGARKITTMAELAVARSENGLVITEYLSGPEYTVDCFTTRDGVLAYASPRVRERISSGIAVRARAVDEPCLVMMAAEISGALGLRGAWFFQAKANDDGVMTLMEVANRVSGTMGFQRERGVNLIEAWLHDLEGREITILPWVYGDVVLDRALTTRVIWDYRPEAVYVDFDDTVVLPNGKLNYGLVGQLYGLRANVGARIVLITRHQADVDLALRRLGLAHLFDEVCHLKRGEPKSSAIAPGRAIFIDDSFSERVEVAKAKGIPTFSLESMACIDGINHAALGDD
jgi:carbamoyl-phosphate synthase large subunit